MRRPAATAAALALALGLGACGGGSGSESTEAAAAAGPEPQLSLTASTHRPVAGQPWPITIRAYAPDGSPLRAEVRYQYLFGGAIVARRSHYRFRGSFHDTFRWPARAVGLPLTFRAVVTTPLGGGRLDYAVRVVRR